MRLRPWFAWLLALGAAALVSVNRLTGNLSLQNNYSSLTVNSTVIAVLAITVLFVTLALVMIRRGNTLVLLSVQAVATFGPIPLTGQGWFAGPFLCACILLSFTGRRAWTLFALAALTDAAAGWLVGGELSLILYVIVVDVANGFALFAIARLAQLIQQTHDERRRLARAEADAERLRSDARLSADVGTQISTLIGRLREILASPEIARAAVVSAGELARQATSDARAIASSPQGANPGSSTTNADRDGVTTELTRWAFALIVIDFTLTSVLNLVWDGQASDHLAAGLVIVALVTALQIHHGTPRVNAGHVRWWSATFGLQVALIAVVTLTHFTDGALLPFLLLAGGTALTRMPIPWSWLVVCLLVAYVVTSPAGRPGVAAAYWAVSVIYWSIVVYALHRLPEVTRHLRSTQGELARLAVATERLRFARDVHDLFSFHFSAISLKVELARQTIDCDRASARSHLTEALRSAEQALADVRSTTASAGQITLSAELHNAKALLEAAGITVNSTSATPVLPRAIDNLAGVFIRESATNVVRHARARACTICVTVQAGDLHLRVTNDGCTGEVTSGGTGLASLATRIRGMRGSLDATSEDGRFTLTARIPVQQQSAPSPERRDDVSLH